MDKCQMLSEWKTYSDSTDLVSPDEVAAREAWESGEDYIFAYIMTLIM